MVDTSQLHTALEKTGMEPDQAPRWRRNWSGTSRPTVLTSTPARAGPTRRVHPGRPGWEPELPFGSVGSWFKQMPHDSFREYWERMPAHAPWILAVLLSFITVPLLLEVSSRRY